MSRFFDRLEAAAPDDLYYDYCLWPYRPLAAGADKLRSANLLYHTFEEAGVGDGGRALAAALQQCVGRFHTVFGIKQAGGGLFWELYFYDYRRKRRRRSMTRVIDALKPFAACRVSPNEALPYFMFSIDVDAALIRGERDLEDIHMYIGNPGSAVSSGICYRLTPDATRLENFYFFFDAERQFDDAAAKIACSAYVDSTTCDLRQILWPEMRGCRVIVAANKQENDSVYFSRITVRQLIRFLEKMNYPERIVSFIAARADRFAHLLFDAGYDYRFEQGRVKILKSGYYGYF